MRLAGWNIRFLDTHFSESTDGDERFTHAILHSFDEGRHGDETRDPKNDSHHGEQRTKLVRQNLFDPNADGVEKIHDLRNRLTLHPGPLSAVEGRGRNIER